MPKEVDPCARTHTHTQKARQRTESCAMQLAWGWHANRFKICTHRLLRGNAEGRGGDRAERERELFIQEGTEHLWLRQLIHGIGRDPFARA